MNQYSKGQSLLELIIAIALFAIVILGLSLFIFNSNNASRLAFDMTKADFLAEEGLEATRSIRDNNYSDLPVGSYGLAISSGHWIFQGANEDLNSELNGGTRSILIEDVSVNRKKISSTVSWNFTENRLEEVKLITYLTNWQLVSVYCEGVCGPCSSFRNKGQCQNQSGCSWSGSCLGVCTPCPSFTDRNSCRKQTGCQWIQ